ncbi:MAG: hypothetical protein MPL62_17360, partial [Alphaproteobacteria bacterium]|nr:hypothetical protein [Alphaproteobacteria bacterium]
PVLMTMHFVFLTFSVSPLSVIQEWTSANALFRDALSLSTEVPTTYMVAFSANKAEDADLIL